MALIACAECAETVSTRAEACPRCGAPVEAPADGDGAGEAAGETFERGAPCGSCGNVHWKLTAAGVREEGKWSKRIAVVATILAAVALVQIFVEGLGAWPGLAVWAVVAIVAWSVHDGRGSYALYECARCGYLQRDSDAVPGRALRPAD